MDCPVNSPEAEGSHRAPGSRDREGDGGRSPRARSQRPTGWSPAEPGSYAAAVLLLIAASFVPWWRSVLDTSVIPFRMSQGVEFSPWIGTTWDFVLLPGTVYRRATALPWWSFGNVFPEYAGYLEVGLTLSILWAAALGLAVFALLARRSPGPRMQGWPTVGALLAFLLVATSVVLSVFAFPAVVGLDSFAGEAGRLSWGPFFGWYVALVAGAFLGAGTAVGWATDRRLRGLCWSCRREAAGPTCDYCGSAQ